MNWEELSDYCNNCKRCALSQAGQKVALGKGDLCAPILFVGEDDKLLDLALEALEFKQEDYYITSITKCRPLSNKAPSQEEVEACIPYLREQFKLIRPKIVVCLGTVASTALLGKESNVSKVRGTWSLRGGTFFTATYHPAALVRDENKKIVMWQDLKAVKRKLEAIYELRELEQQI